MVDLRPSEIEEADFALQIFQSDKPGMLDTFYLGDVLRGLNLNPSIAALEAAGMTKKKGEKLLTREEFLKVFSDIKKAKKDQGCYEDFVELLKLYDKEENGKMALSELQHSLAALGEKLTEEQIDEVFTDCLPEEDDDGMIVYDIFLRKMCDREEK